MELHPATEKVPARRGLAVVVGLAALAVVAVLVARPWDRAPAVTPPVAIGDAPSASTSAPQGGSTNSPAHGPGTGTSVPIPTSDAAPLGPLGDVALAAAPDAALAECQYGRARSGVRPLAAVEVQPPVVLLDAGSSVSDIKRVGWWFELEMNSAADLFDRGWEAVRRSRGQVVGTVEGRAARFTALTLRNTMRDIDPTALFRVRVVVEWYTRNFEIAGRAEIVANSYQEASNELIGSWPLFCRGLLRVESGD